jgi:hypothetical protein
MNARARTGTVVDEDPVDGAGVSLQRDESTDNVSQRSIVALIGCDFERASRGGERPWAAPARVRRTTGVDRALLHHPDVTRVDDKTSRGLENEPVSA